MKYLNQIQNEFLKHAEEEHNSSEKQAISPQMMIPNLPVHQLTTSHPGQIEPDTFTFQVKVHREPFAKNYEFCHSLCPWLHRKEGNLPHCRLFKTPLTYENSPSLRAFITQKCFEAINWASHPKR